MTSNKIGRDAAVITASKIITLLISMVSAMLLSRFRTLSEYGTYSQLIILNGLASSFFSLGLPNSTNYFLARAESVDERRKFLSAFYTLLTLISIIIGVALVLSIPLSVAYFDNPGISSFAFFLALLPWTKVIIGTISNVLVVYGKAKKILLLNLINSLVSLSAILFVQAFGWSFRDYITIYLCGECCITIWIYIIVYRLEGGIKPYFNKEIIGRLLRYSVPLGLATLVGTINIEIDKLMIGGFFDTENMAVYTNAARELPLTIVSASFTSALLPQMAKRLKDNDAKGALEIWGYSIRLSYIILCFFVMACLVFAPQMISILYSNKYLPGVGVFRVYALVLLLRVTYFGMVLNSAGKTRFIFWCSLASLGLNAVLNYLMYLAFGFIGPAIATFLSIGLINGLQLLVTARHLQVAFRRIFPWRSIAVITLVNLVTGALLYAITIVLKIGTDTKGNATAVFIGFVAMVIYAACLKSRIGILWRKLNGKE